MTIPPRGDSRRPLHLAILSTWLLGIAFIAAGCCLGVCTRNARIRPGSLGYWLHLLSVGFLVVSGAGSLVIAAFLGRRHRWAIVAGLVFAWIHLLLALAGLYCAVDGLCHFRLMGWVQGVSTLTVAILMGVVPLLILILWAAAMVQLIRCLAKSFTAMRIEEQTIARGFAPLSVESA